MRLIYIILIATLINACSQDSDGDENLFDGEDVSVVLGQNQVSTPIQADGIVNVEFTLEESVTTVQLVSQASAVRIRLISIIGPAGKEYFNSADSFDARSVASDQFQIEQNVINFPIIGKDDLQELPKGTYIAKYQTQLIDPNQSSLAAESLTTAILSKQDSDITSGVLPLRVVVPKVIADSDRSLADIDSALEIVQEILQRAGVSLNFVMIVDARVPGVLPNAAKGAELYRQIAAEREPGLFLYIGTGVDQLQGPLNTIAQAGSIPGSYFPSTRSAISVSLSAAAGGDGIIDSSDDRDNPQFTSESRLFAEAMAHEIMHYLGLQDTIVLSGGTTVDSDVTDSPKCPNLEACRLDADASHNIMFPYPLDRRISDTLVGQEQDQFIPREEFSTLQVVIAQTAVGME